MIDIYRVGNIPTEVVEMLPTLDICVFENVMGRWFARILVVVYNMLTRTSVNNKGAIQKKNKGENKLDLEDLIPRLRIYRMRSNTTKCINID